MKKAILVIKNTTYSGKVTMLDFDQDTYNWFDGVLIEFTGDNVEQKQIQLTDYGSELDTVYIVSLGEWITTPRGKFGFVRLYE